MTVLLAASARMTVLLAAFARMTVLLVAYEAMRQWERAIENIPKMIKLQIGRRYLIQVKKF
jgi:lipopolysaccharide biosynthesis regulator YciM